jgi:hypothetical protein
MNTYTMSCHIVRVVTYALSFERQVVVNEAPPIRATIPLRVRGQAKSRGALQALQARIPLLTKSKREYGFDSFLQHWCIFSKKAFVTEI